MEYKKVNSGATVNGLTMANFEVRQGRIYLAKDKRLVAVNQKQQETYQILKDEETKLKAEYDFQRVAEKGEQYMLMNGKQQVRKLTVEETDRYQYELQIYLKPIIQELKLKIEDMGLETIASNQFGICSFMTNGKLQQFSFEESSYIRFLKGVKGQRLLSARRIKQYLECTNVQYHSEYKTFWIFHNKKYHRDLNFQEQGIYSLVRQMGQRQGNNRQRETEELISKVDQLKVKLQQIAGWWYDFSKTVWQRIEANKDKLKQINYIPSFANELKLKSKVYEPTSSQFQSQFEREKQQDKIKQKTIRLLGQLQQQIGQTMALKTGWISQRDILSSKLDQSQLAISKLTTENDILKKQINDIKNSVNSIKKSAIFQQADHKPKSDINRRNIFDSNHDGHSNQQTKNSQIGQQRNNQQAGKVVFQNRTTAQIQNDKTKAENPCQLTSQASESDKKHQHKKIPQCEIVEEPKPIQEQSGNISSLSEEIKGFKQYIQTNFEGKFTQLNHKLSQKMLRMNEDNKLAKQISQEIKKIEDSLKTRRNNAQRIKSQNMQVLEQISKQSLNQKAEYINAQERQHYQELKRQNLEASKGKEQSKLVLNDQINRLLASDKTLRERQKKIEQLYKQLQSLKILQTTHQNQVIIQITKQLQNERNQFESTLKKLEQKQFNLMKQLKQKQSKAQNKLKNDYWLAIDQKKKELAEKNEKLASLDKQYQQLLKDMQRLEKTQANNQVYLRVLQQISKIFSDHSKNKQTPDIQKVPIMLRSFLDQYKNIKQYENKVKYQNDELNKQLTIVSSICDTYLMNQLVIQSLSKMLRQMSSGYQRQSQEFKQKIQKTFEVVLQKEKDFKEEQKRLTVEWSKSKEELERMKSANEERMAVVMDQIEDLKKNLCEFNSGKENSLFTLKVQTQQNSKLKTRIHQLQSTNSRLECEQKAVLKQKQTEKEQMQTKITRLQAEYQRRVGEVSIETTKAMRLKNQLDESQRQLQNKTVEIAELKKMQQNLSATKQYSEKQFNDLKSLLNSRTQQLEDWRAKYQQKQVEYRNNILNVTTQLNQVKQQLQVEQSKLAKGLQGIEKTLNIVYHKAVDIQNFNDIETFIQSNSQNQSSTVLTISQILQGKNEQRAFLVNSIQKFKGKNIIASKLLFKYDEWSKNFANYLPNKTLQFNFVILFKTKVGLFGCFAEGICDKDSPKYEAFMFSLIRKQCFYKGPRAGQTQSVKIQETYLTFGNSQMKMRTNFFNEISVTSRAGAKYFDMTREQLTNGEEETIKIEEMEVHRILFVE